MPIVLLTPNSNTNNLCGPGIPWQVQPAVAIAVGHHIEVTIRTLPSAGSVSLLSSQTDLNHATSGTINGAFGWNSDEDQVSVRFADFQQTPFDGQAVQIHIDHTNASFVSLETRDILGFTYNSVIGLYECIKQFKFEVTQAGVSSGAITDILNAVRRVATTPGQI